LPLETGVSWNCADNPETLLVASRYGFAFVLPPAIEGGARLRGPDSADAAQQAPLGCEEAHLQCELAGVTCNWTAADPAGMSGGLRKPQRAHQAADIDDQCHAAIAHDGGAGHTVYAAIVVLEVLDDHLLLAQ